MELVKGVPITKYCDDHKLTPRQRLELFVPVCQAIQHAHQKGIIHRDIKPSNVLVALYDDRPVPKVIDFGVAKATGVQLTEATLHTGFGAVVGTLEYMSPEQASFNQLDVDTRSDIYSLGVLLYELLAGSPPFSKKDLETAGMLEMLRVIREQEPSKPSTKLSSSDALPSISANRGTEPSRLTKLVRGELDWIVMRALEKDRSRRYETANGFAMDVQRYLADETVQACPPSIGYRVRKFVRRNKVAVAFSGLVLLVLLTATGGIAWNVRDRTARQAAIEDEAASAVKEAERLQEQGKYSEAMSAARRAAGLLGSGGGAAIRLRVRELCDDLEMIQRLEEIRLQMASYAEDSFDYRGADVEYARAFLHYGVDVEQLEIAKAGDFIRNKSIRLQLAAALDHWADARRSLQKTDDRRWRDLLAVARVADADEWRTQIRDALERQDRDRLIRLVDSPKVSELPASTKCLLGQALAQLGEAHHASRFLWKAQLQHPNDFWINYELAGCRNQMRPHHPDEVVRFYTAALALRPDSAAVHIHLGNALRAHGKPGPALVTLRAALRLDPESAIAHYNLGRFLKDQKQFDEAIAAYRDAIALKPDYAEAYGSLGIVWAQKGELDEAIDATRKAIQLKPDLAEAHYNLGLHLKQKGRMDDAVAAYREAIRLQPKHANAHNNLGNVLAEREQYAEAVVAFRKAIELQPDYAIAHNNLGNAFLKQGKHAEAIPAYRNAIRLQANYFAAHHNLCIALNIAGNSASAIQAFERIVKNSNDDCSACEGGFYLAMTYWLTKDRAAARQWYDRSVDRMARKTAAAADLRALRTKVEMLIGIDPLMN